MFSFVKRLFNSDERQNIAFVDDSVAIKDEVSEKKRRNEDNSGIVTGIAAGDVVDTEITNAGIKFTKPESYAGNRKLYDDSTAKKMAKEAAFGNKKVIKETYTGQDMVKTQAESREMYGDIGNSAETDHVVSLHEIHDKMKDNPWVTNKNVKEIANSDENLVVTSRRFNNFKREKSNSEVVQDTKGLKEKSINMSRARKKRALQDEENAKNYIQKQEAITSIKNAIETGHQAGVNTAMAAGKAGLVFSGIQNVVDVINGKKTAGEALSDTAVTGGKAAVTGYCLGGGMTVLSHTLSSSSSPFIRSLAKSNVPGQVITAVMTFGNTLKRYGNNEITTQQFILEVGSKGLSAATAGYAAVAGQAIIPIPVVGAAIGAVVGTVMTNSYFADLMTQLERKEIEHQERLRIIEESKRAAVQARAYREELEKYLDAYFKDCHDCFDAALSNMQISYRVGDADGVISGANQITRKLGGTVYFDSVDEYKSFLDSDEADIL